jgi:hypothetical protein
MHGASRRALTQIKTKRCKAARCAHYLRPAEGAGLADRQIS